MTLIKAISLKNLLSLMKNTDINTSSAKSLGKKIFLGFYEIAEHKEKPTKEDKLEILHLANNVSHKLINYADSYKARFYLTWEEDEELMFKIHSGFQYFKDDYVNILIDELEPNIKESIKSLVESIDYDELNECMKYLAEKTTCYLPVKPDFVPEEHIWWISK
jgi:hypothetical protein